MPAVAFPTTWVHGHDAINPRAFKQAMRAVAGSVAILASEHDEIGFCGITATAVCSFSAEPPSLLACVNRSSTFASAIREGLPFSVNLPAGDQENVARAFGGMTSAKGVARFSSGSWVRGETGAPLLWRAGNVRLPGGRNNRAGIAPDRDRHCLGGCAGSR